MIRHTLRLSIKDMHNSNARSHRAVVAKKRAALRALAGAEFAGFGPQPVPARIVFSFGWPDRRRRDPDNYELKGCLDGLVDCGVLPDDNGRCVPLTARRDLGVTHDDKGYLHLTVTIMRDDGEDVVGSVGRPAPELTREDRRELVSHAKHRVRQFLAPFDALEPWYRWDAALHRWEDTPAGLHTTVLPSLLDQLAQAIGGIAGGGGAHGGGYESKPTAAAPVMDTQAWLVDELADVVGAYFHRRPQTLRKDLLTVYEHMHELSDADLLAVRRRVRAWWTAAKVMSGLEARPLVPHMKCPACQTQDSIQCRLDVASTTGLAWCLSCRESWDETNLHELAAEAARQADDSLDTLS